MPSEVMRYNEIQQMAQDVVRGGLFPGVKTVEQAITLFMIAQSEGMHPLTATMRYNIIQGRPAMKADAMLASFMERGGTVEWTEYGDERVTGVFTSQGCPKGVSVTWTIADARRAGITGNPTWTKYPRQMLKARVASDGVRMADPAVNQGRYSPEEHESFEEASEVKPAEIVAQNGQEEATSLSISANRSGKTFAAIEEPGKATGELAAAGGKALTDVIFQNVDKALFDSLKEAQNKDPEVVAEIVAETGDKPNNCYCGSEIGIYFSTQEKYPNRPYFMCARAHKDRDALLDTGLTSREANAAVAKCYRAWASKWGPEREQAEELELKAKRRRAALHAE